MRALSPDPRGGRVYVGGRFSVGDSRTQRSLATIDLGSGAVAAWGPNANSGVWAIAPSADGQTVYLGGAFTTVDAKARRRLAAVRADDGALLPSTTTVVPPGVEDLGAFADLDALLDALDADAQAGLEASNPISAGGAEAGCPIPDPSTPTASTTRIAVATATVDGDEVVVVRQPATDPPVTLLVYRVDDCRLLGVGSG